MKRIAILMMCIATLAMSGCSALSTATSSNAVAKASGQACGTAVQGLYSAYRNTGTVDLTNSTNLNNALALATSYAAMKENKGDTNYRKAFINGLIASSAGLITSQNAAAFVDKMLATAGLSNITAQGIAQTASTAAAVVNLLSVLKQ